MYQDRFFYLLNQLTPKEFKQFKRWFNTLSENRRQRSLKIANKSWIFFEPYRNKIQNVDRDTIVSFKKKLYALLHPKKKYDNITLNKYLHELSTLLEEFLIVLEVQNNKLKRREMLMSVAKSRNMTDEYFSNIEQQKRLVEEQTDRSFNYYYKQLELNYLSYFHPETEKYKAKYEGYVPKVALEQIIEALNYFYWITKYAIICEVQNRINLLSESYDIEKLLDSDLNDLIASPILNVYQKLFEYYKTPSIDLYFDLKPRMLKQIKTVSHNEQQNLLTNLYNMQSLIINQNRTNQNLLVEVIEVAKFGFEQKVFSPKIYIGENLFLGFFQVARVVDVAWSKILLEKHQVALPFERRENTINLCKAMDAFYANDFETANEYLQLIQYDNFTYLVRARAFQLMCYVELKEKMDVDIFNYGTNFIRHLKNNKFLNEDIKTSFINFVKFVQQLMSFQADFETIEANLNQTPKIIAKNWLVEKLNQFKNK